MSLNAKLILFLMISTLVTACNSEPEPNEEAKQFQNSQNETSEAESPVKETRIPKSLERSLPQNTDKSKSKDPAQQGKTPSAAPKVPTVDSQQLPTPMRPPTQVQGTKSQKPQPQAGPQIQVPDFTSGQRSAEPIPKPRFKPTQPNPSVAPAAPAPKAPAAKNFEDDTEDDLSQIASMTLVLPSNTNVYVLQNGKLSKALILPKTAVISYSSKAKVQNFSIDETVTINKGFVGPVNITKLPKSYLDKLTPEQLSQILSLSGFIYISAEIMADRGSSGHYSAIALKDSEEILSKSWTKYFESNGRTKYPAKAMLKNRAVFGHLINIPNDRLRADERTKFEKVFSEIAVAVNREVSTPKQYMILDPKQLAERVSALLKFGTVGKYGAHSVAVKGVAERYFKKTPCAEFVSEVVRQAYLRAGYDYREDFNEDKKNPLKWLYSYKDNRGNTINRNGSSVQGLTESFAIAGWIPWTADEFIPPVGAIMATQKATSPGHIYFVGGYNGFIIVDNGAPQGRDIRTQPERYLAWSGKGANGKSNKGVWTNSVFFLPPGMTPKRWPQLDQTLAAR